MYITIDVMKNKKILLMPSIKEVLETMGEQIKLSRLRRDFSMDMVAKRANISRATLYKIEKGDPSVSMGHYAVALHALNNMDKIYY